MDLFSGQQETKVHPLAYRMRPRKLEDFRGQEHLLGEGKPLRRLIETDAISSIILWGPPGCGKTSLAYLISSLTHRRFVSLSAVNAGVADLRHVFRIAEQELRLKGRQTILFIDEVHRFNKTQQDAILPYVEQGTVTLIGATTQNPSFEIIPALRSRSQILQMQSLSSQDIRWLIERALQDKERGVTPPVELETGAAEMLVAYANGDARIALSGLEAAAAVAQGMVSDH